MKDVTGFELEVGNYVVLSANVSTASQAILFAKVVRLLPKSVEVAYYQRDHKYIGDTKVREYVITTNVQSSKRILIVPKSVIPADAQNTLDEYMEEL